LKVGTLTLIAGELLRKASLLVALLTNTTAVQLLPSTPARRFVKS